MRLRDLATEDEADATTTDHRTDKVRRFERPESLLVERFPEHVGFEHDLAERFFRARNPRPDRVVPFSQGRE